MMARATLYFDGSVSGYYHINPREYLHCSDEEELMEAVTRDLINTLLNDHNAWGRVNIDELYERDWDIPAEFIETWKQLKHESI